MSAAAPGFRHEALLYAGDDEFLEGTLSFIRDGLEKGDRILVAVSERKIGMLGAELDGDAAAVRFADMGAIGRNPALIIPVWGDFVREHAESGEGLRGIGEPAWPGRSVAELAECRQHESLLNRAFADAPPWWLLCPYDTERLDASVLGDAERSHPFVQRHGASMPSTSYDAEGGVQETFEAPLPDPPDGTPELAFEEGSLGAVRGFVGAQAAALGVDGAAVEDLVLAVNEVASNSLRHGGGTGFLRIWRDGPALVCEVRDDGRIEDPMVGRTRPDVGDAGGRGLWIVNHLCDLVQLRTSRHGTAVRLHVRADHP